MIQFWGLHRRMQTNDGDATDGVAVTQEMKAGVTSVKGETMSDQ